VRRYFRHFFWSWILPLLTGISLSQAGLIPFTPDIHISFHLFLVDVHLVYYFSGMASVFAWWIFFRSSKGLELLAIGSQFFLKKHPSFLDWTLSFLERNPSWPTSVPSFALTYCDTQSKDSINPIPLPTPIVI
jgi:hypothetical protein